MTAAATAPSVADLVAQIAPTVRQYAAQAETQRRLAPEVVNALLDAGVLTVLTPRAYGGLELDPRTALQLFEAIAHLDSAAGWITANSAMIATLPMALPAAGGDEL